MRFSFKGWFIKVIHPWVNKITLWINNYNWGVLVEKRRKEKTLVESTLEGKLPRPEEKLPRPEVGDISGQVATGIDFIKRHGRGVKLSTNKKEKVPCRHLKGGGGPTIYDDYNVMDHTFCDGSRWIKCLTCGKKWERGDSDWKEALRMVSESTNSPSSSEIPLERLVFKDKSLVGVPAAMPNTWKEAVMPEKIYHEEVIETKEKKNVKKERRNTSGNKRRRRSSPKVRRS